MLENRGSPPHATLNKQSSVSQGKNLAPLLSAVSYEKYYKTNAKAVLAIGKCSVF